MKMMMIFVTQLSSNTSLNQNLHKNVHLEPICTHNHSQNNSLCNLDQINDGHWDYDYYSNSYEHGTYEHCPSLKKFSKDNYSMKYTKPNSTFRSACYHFHQCRILKFSQAVNDIKLWLRGREILFVGDSVCGQQYMALKCELEHKSTATLKVKVIWQPTLMNGVRCSESCLVDSTFLATENKKSDSATKCFDCKDGLRKPLTAPWVEQVKNRTVGILVLNAVAHYITKKGVDDPLNTYKEALTMLSKLLQRMISNGIMVVWNTFPINQTSHKRDENIDEKNKFAKDLFQPIGVLVVDLTDIVTARVIRDPNTTVDYTHMTNPAPTGLHSFTSHMLLHFIAMKIREK